MHLGRNPNPKLIIYLNNGDGVLTEHIIDGETRTHEAKVADIGSTGRPSIVGKPFKPKAQVDLWENLAS